MGSVLLTGSSGRIGRRIAPALEAAGHQVVPFDLAHGDDVTDAATVLAAARGVDAIIHSAAIPDDDADWELAPRTMPVNLIGTWNVLLAAREHQVGRVVTLSSGKAVGMLERDPDYLPVDDDHRGRPSLPYALSKWLSEEMCEAFTHETGIATICLRPVLVLDPTRYPLLASGSELPPVPGMRWHLGVWIDVDDVANAAVAAVGCPDPGHARLLLCADDVGSERATAELVAEQLPGVPWRGAPLTAGSRRALVDTARARELLGWAPAVTWADRHERVDAAR
ncbi:MAG TPA: NAD(P)-dependent oxidoreductase [Conexibacter sp.]|nr:NAD(P)-dependent oxidoreductase [Conexibacter sp.]